MQYRLPLALGAVALGLVATGCSSPGTSPMLGRSLLGQDMAIQSLDHPGARAGAPRKFVYVCGATFGTSFEGACDVYDTRGKLLTELPQSAVRLPYLTKLSGRYWYVPDLANQKVVILTQGRSPRVVGSLASPTFPADVAVYRSNGTIESVAVSDYSGRVDVYEHGASSPSYTLPAPKAKYLQGAGVAFDSHGDCAWSYHGPSEGHVLFYQGCKGKYKDLGLSVNAGGVLFDQHDNLIVANQSKGALFCTGTSNCKLAVRNSSAGLLGIGLTADGTALWAAGNSNGTIYEYAYPSGKLDFSFKWTDSPYLSPIGVAAT
jgi:hypothetical protein